MHNQFKLTAVFIAATLLAATSAAFAQNNCEQIDATAMGTSSQMGRIGNVRFRFCRSATDQERQAFIAAYQKGKTPGLTRALQKGPSMGRISLPSSVGYDLAYVREVDTPTGRRIRFVTDRKIAFGENYQGTRSSDYSLTAGEINIDSKDKSKSIGTLYPAALIRVNKQGEVTWELFQNPWKLDHIVDWGIKGKDNGE